jgi:hypothetical protein
MNVWPLTVSALTQQEIQDAVKNEDWQEFRKSLKGLPTEDKLEELFEYLCTRTDIPFATAQIRVDNYINALLRGGQLVRRGGKIVVQR